MPCGDNDEDIIDENLDESELLCNPPQKSDSKKLNDGKFMALYDDAKHRTLRKEHIYKKCVDKECTFKPKLITQDSKISKMTIKEVQKRVQDRSKQSISETKSNGKSEKPAVTGVPP